MKDVSLLCIARPLFAGYKTVYWDIGNCETTAVNLHVGPKLHHASMYIYGTRGSPVGCSGGCA